MLDAKNKVLLISPQHWGTMRVSKHHYAIELAKLGHDVYFLEPTDASWQWNSTSFDICPSDAQGVTLVRQKINVPYNLKFHAKGLFDFFIKQHIHLLQKQLGHFDLVWSFDLTNALPLKYFSKTSKKIFFAADWPQVNDALKAAEGANLLVSVAQEILDQYPSNPLIKKILVDHGVAECFIEAGKQPFLKVDDTIRIGMSGNFLRPDIDRPVILEIINSHPDLVFECFGVHDPKISNLGGNADHETISFVETLKCAQNVILHGMVPPETLAKELRRMDAFLICYDVKKDQSKGTNYHKVMEYLAYGRPIISNVISMYLREERADLLSMASIHKNINQIFDEELIDLLAGLNNRGLKMQEFSFSNRYSNNLLKIISSF
jgi:hypothetical protein